jgi:hypothetical protein
MENGTSTQSSPNVDTVFVTQSLDNGPNLRRLGRKARTLFSSADPVIVLTKPTYSPTASTRPS